MIEIAVAAIAAIAAIASAFISAKQNRKVNETHRQVTVNSHASETPTVLDLIAELRDEQREMRDEQQETNQALHRHLEWHLDRQ